MFLYCFLFFAGSLLANPKYLEIRNAIPTYYKTKFTPLGMASEGAIGVIYAADNSIKMAEATYYGSMGKSLYELYYADNQLFLVIEKTFTYNAPIYMTQQEVDSWYKEDGIEAEVYDDKKTRVDEFRYSFSDGKLQGYNVPDKVQFILELSQHVVSQFDLPSKQLKQDK